MNKQKQILLKGFYYINEWPLKFHGKYGILGLVALLAVPLKLWLFYSLIGITSNFVIVWLITCLLTIFLFTSFKNKWIPAGIFLAITILIFADVTYASFFNRYLSIDMLGSAGFIGDITASIKEVLRPIFGVLFLDNLFVFGAVTYHHVMYKKREKNRLEKVKAEKERLAREAEALEPQWVDTFLEFIKEKKENKKWKKICRFTKRYALQHKSGLMAIFLILLILSNVTGSGLVTSIANQEIYTYHIQDILKSGSSGEGSLKNVASFQKSYEKEKEGPLFGVAEGKNLIVIQMESFQNFVINREYNGQELTPNLNALIQDQGSLYFDNYYQQIGSGNTSDAELATNNSLYGSLTSYTYKNQQDNYFKGLPVLLKEKGYNTSAFHSFWDTDFWNRANIYPNLGFDNFYGGEHGSTNNSFDLTEKMGWGLSDTEFFAQSMDYIKAMPQPFYNFMITLSNHHPYQMLDKYQFVELLPEDEGTLVGNYLNSVAYTDYAIGQFIEQLKEEGLYDNTVIALYGDHLGLTLNDNEISESMTRLLGKEYDFEDMMKIPLIINVPGLDESINQTVSVSGGQLDFLPTIAYLMGFETLDTVYLGHNLLTIESGFVTEQTYMTKGSFFQDDIVYEMSRDGVFENGRAYNQKTGELVPIEDCYEGYLRSMDTINASEYILENDILRKMFLEGEDAVTAFSEKTEHKYPEEIVIAGLPNFDLVGTNSLEALNTSYDAGYRTIKVDVNWTSEVGARTPILLNSWEEFPTYFESEETAEITIEEFSETKMKNGLTSMDGPSLAQWIGEHPDVTIVANPDRSSDFFMRTMSSYEGINMDRIIPEVEGMVEYSGLHNGILFVDKGNYTSDQLLEFIKLNNVWAVSMSQKSAEGKYKDLVKSKYCAYIYEVDRGLLTKGN